jgi:hypothetical protein
MADGLTVLVASMREQLAALGGLPPDALPPALLGRRRGRPRRLGEHGDALAAARATFTVRTRREGDVAPHTLRRRPQRGLTSRG